MMRRLISSLALALLLLMHMALPARAIDAGTVTGFYESDGRRITFAHAIAVRQDNAEGNLMGGAGIWVMLSDRPVAPEQIWSGGDFPPVRELAKAGKVHGLLLRFSPNNQEELSADVLSVPDGALPVIANLSRSNSGGLWEALEVAATRVTGALKPSEGLEVRFSAPLFHNPVTQDLTGKAAQASPFVALLVRHAEAMGRGDIAAAKALMVLARHADLDAIPPEYLPEIRKEAPAMAASARAATRVIVRGDTATVVMPGGAASLVREGGVWKIS